MIAINVEYHARGTRGLRDRTVNACTGFFAMWSVLAVDFFNSSMFPTKFSLEWLNSVHDVNGSSILNMAIVRGAIVPLMQGAIADHIAIH